MHFRRLIHQVGSRRLSVTGQVRRINVKATLCGVVHPGIFTKPHVKGNAWISGAMQHDENAVASETIDAHRPFVAEEKETLAPVGDRYFLVGGFRGLRRHDGYPIQVEAGLRAAESW